MKGSVVFSPWLIGKLWLFIVVNLLIPLLVCMIVPVPHSTSWVFSLALCSLPCTSFHLSLGYFKRTNVFKHAESSFFRHCHVKDIYIWLCDTVNSVHHDACILSKQIAIEIHLTFICTKITSQVSKLATITILTDVRWSVVCLAKCDFVPGGNVGLLVQVLSSMCESTLIAKFTFTFLPILAKFCFLFLLVRRFVCLILTSDGDFFWWWWWLFRKGKLLSTFTVRVKVFRNFQSLCIGLEFRSKAIEGISCLLIGEFVLGVWRLVIAFIRLDGSLCGLTVSEFIIAVFERW